MAPLVATVWGWLDERTGLNSILEVASKKTVPEHRYSFAYYLGGATLFLLVIQVVTGILLALYYRASAEEAHQSLQHLITRVPFGDLMRSVHAWSADLMIAVLFAHMFSVWIMRGYRRPRELTWVFGCVLLFLSISLGFTGYLLPWNELAYFATRVGTEIAGDVPVIGGWLRGFLRGGEEVTGLTLSRFFGFHIAVLPALVFASVVVHLLLVQRLGISVPKGISERDQVKEIPFFPNGFVRDLIYWFVLLGIVVTLATFFPRELGEPADPFAPAPANIKPEWYFLFAFQALKILPATLFGIEGEAIGIFAFVIAGIFLVVLPFIDRKGRPIFMYAGWAAVVFFVGFTIYGWLD